MMNWVVGMKNIWAWEDRKRRGNVCDVSEWLKMNQRRIVFIVDDYIELCLNTLWSKKKDRTYYHKYWICTIVYTQNEKKE